MNTKNLITKECPFCAETINRAAKVCPQCRQWQTFKSLANPATLVWLMCSLMGGGIFVFLLLINSVINPKPDFEAHKNDLAVTHSKVVFYRNEKGDNLRTLLILTNRGTVQWKNVEVEVRFFDKNGTLIDVGASVSGDRILDHGELGMAIRGTPCQLQSNYVSHQVFVRGAKNARAWP